jgi:pyruvate/2-oxoglutarate dehydrogenase complex dihydrolipoamide dehydrogenase (E3) component
VDDVRFSRQGIADHAENLVTGIRNNLTNSMVSLGVDVLKGQASLRDNHTVSYGNKKCTAQNIIIATVGAVQVDSSCNIMPHSLKAPGEPTLEPMK